MKEDSAGARIVLAGLANIDFNGPLLLLLFHGMIDYIKTQIY